MNQRITFIATFDDSNLEKINYYIKKLDDKLCRVPFGKNVDNRIEADKLPYHFTLSSYSINKKDEVIRELSNIRFPKLKVFINNVGIMAGKENSYVLYFNIEGNDKLKLLQQIIYKILPNEAYNSSNFQFHITIHIDKDYTKIMSMKEKILQKFKPFELDVDTFCLYEIWESAKLIKKFKGDYIDG